MDNATRRELLQRHKMSGFPGSIMDVYQAYGQGVDLIKQYEQQQVAQQQPTAEILQQPTLSAPQPTAVQSQIKAKIQSPQAGGNLVKSYDNQSLGLSNLGMGSQEGMQFQMRTGGPTDPPKWESTVNKINQNWGPNQLGDTLDLNTLELIAIERMGVQNPMAVMDSIGYHETGPHQRMQYNAVQIADDKQGNEFPGDGKGKYMYDKPSTETAANRINTIAQNMGMVTPPFAQQLRDTDGTSRADTLAPEQQDMLILADMIAGDKAPFRAYGRGDVSLEDLWYRGHNRRDDEKDARAEFRESMRGLKNDDLNNYMFMEPKPNYFEQKRFGGVNRHYKKGARTFFVLPERERTGGIRKYFK